MGAKQDLPVADVHFGSFTLFLLSVGVALAMIGATENTKN
jgi:hypothetical protein